MIRLLILFLSSSLLFISCNSNEIGNSKDVDPETIWFDYKIWGEEGNDYVTVMLQYRFAGSNGTTLMLDEPSTVELDGTLIKADSSRMTGAFYETLRPLTEFSGRHTIVFTNTEGRKYREEFRFQPIRLRSELPAILPRGDLLFELDGLDPVDQVRILLTDTSYTSDGINRVETVRNGKLVIPKAELKQLVNGPIHMELIRENERRVREGTREGGRISVSYGLRRAFTLQD